jgi:two-component system, OmpR family, response regulator QseB
MRILLVEDDEALGSSICVGLKQRGYTVDWLKNGQLVLNYIAKEEFDVVLLDLNLPGKLQGLDILIKARNQKIKTPILILTALDSIESRVKGLNNGADYYVTKRSDYFTKHSLDLEELSACIQALYRRSTGGRATSTLVYRDIILDTGAMKVTVSGQELHISRREFSLLQKLLENVGRVVHRESFLKDLYGWAEDIDSNTLEVHVHNLRKKLGTTAIKTIRGVGYMIEAEKE